MMTETIASCRLSNDEGRETILEGTRAGGCDARKRSRLATDDE